MTVKLPRTGLNNIILCSKLSDLVTAWNMTGNMEEGEMFRKLFFVCIKLLNIVLCQHPICVHQIKKQLLFNIAGMSVFPQDVLYYSVLLLYYVNVACLAYRICLSLRTIIVLYLVSILHVHGLTTACLRIPHAVL